jgi:tetratricopeptide (TPR) repeat protein
VTVVAHDLQRRAGEAAGSSVSGAGAILDGMPATLTSPTFVGRTEELARLTAARDRAAAGIPTAVLVGGEAGVGKTRLVTELMVAARAAGATVLVGGCVELGGEGVPFAPLIEALRVFVRDLDEPELARLVPAPVRVELARLLPELGPPAGEPGRGFHGLETSPPADLGSDQGRLFELLLGLLERLGEERPAVLLVEDLHWADRSTRDLLAFLHRNLRHGRLLLVLTYRSDELHRRHPLRPFLAELDRGRRVERLELARFSQAEVAAQLAGILGAPAPARLTKRIHDRSGGNAFFVEELAATATAGADGKLPPSLRDTLLARIELLSEPTQQVLRAVATAGGRVEHDLLAEVAGLAEPELLAGLREAVSAHVLLADAADGTYGFRHALVKEAVYAELLPGERTRLHARFAAALAAIDGEGGPGLAAELAWHWYAAHDLGRALPAAVEAGLAAERAYAFAEAQRHYERALELWERGGPVGPEGQGREGLGRVELLARAAEAAANAGAADRALALIRAALAEVDAGQDPLLAGQLTERLAYHLRITGRPGAFEAYQEAVRLVPPAPTVERARVLAGLGQALMLRARFAEATATCEEAIEVARAAGAPAVQSHALTSLGSAAARLGDPEGGLARLREARRLAAELGAATDEARACLNLSDLLDDLGRQEEAVAVASEGLEVARAAGLQRTWGRLLGGNAVVSLFHLGRWDEAARLADANLELGDEDLSSVTLRQARAAMDAARGDFEAEVAAWQGA